MRAAVFFLPLLSVANGLADTETTGTCLLDSGEAVSDAMDAAMFMWAAIDRCEKKGEAIKCSVGLLSTVQSMQGMLNVVLKALNKCGDFTPSDYKCTMAGLELTKAASGVGASAANVAQHCENPQASVAAAGNQGTLLTNGNWPQQDPAQCIVDAKDSLKDLFKAVQGLMKVQNRCAMGAEKCAADVLAITSALTGMGGYIAGAVGHCSPPDSVAGSVCSEASLLLVDDLNKVAKAGVQIHEHCMMTSSRLFEEITAKKVQKTSFASPTNLILAAFIPVTAVLGFVGGSRFLRSSGAARDFLSDNE
jgi:hypothetical protein